MILIGRKIRIIYPSMICIAISEIVVVLLEVFLKIDDKFETFVVQMNKLRSYQIASLVFGY